MTRFLKIQLPIKLIFLKNKEKLLENYKNIFIIYAVFMMTLFHPYLLMGDVITPHLQSIEVGTPSFESNQIENRKFSDFSNGYIPEIHDHLHGAKSGWLTLWTNKNELGRAAHHLSGFSSAYFPSFIIAKIFTDNPWNFITILSLSTTFFAGLFIMLFCREIGLAPLSGLVAAINLAASPFFMYWLTFPMFIATWCWNAAALWGLARIAKKSDALGWGILTFSIYSLGMTAYPQPVIYHFYILLGFGLYLAYLKLKIGNPREFLYFLLISLSAGTTGVLLCLPVYLDLAHVASESSRVGIIDTSFYLIYLPKLYHIIDTLRYISISILPELFGNPITPEYPLIGYDGLSITLPVFFLAAIGALTAFKKTLGWTLASIIFIAFTFIPSFYAFGVNHLGFNLSPSIPIGTSFLPLVIMGAIGIDKLSSMRKAGSRQKIVLFALLLTISTLVICLSFSILSNAKIQLKPLLLTSITLFLIGMQINKHRPLLLISSIVVATTVASFPLMLHHPFESISRTSELVTFLKKQTTDDSRYLVADSELNILPPNLNVTLDLSSIHTYNSLSSAN